MGERAKVDILKERLISFTQINCTNKELYEGSSPHWFSVPNSCVLHYLKCRECPFRLSFSMTLSRELGRPLSRKLLQPMRLLCLQRQQSLNPQTKSSGRWNAAVGVMSEERK